MSITATAAKKAVDRYFQPPNAARAARRQVFILAGTGLLVFLALTATGPVAWLLWAWVVWRAFVFAMLVIVGPAVSDELTHAETGEVAPVVEHQPVSIQDSVWCSVRECDWREDGPVSFVEHALLASGVVVPAAEPGGLSEAERGLISDAVHAAEEGDLAAMDLECACEPVYAAVERILAARAPAREADGLRAAIEAGIAEWQAAIATVGAPDQDVELVLATFERALAATPARDGLVERVRDLAVQLRSDQYRVLDYERDPFRQGWRQRSVEVVEMVDALLAEDAATDGGEGRG